MASLHEFDFLRWQPRLRRSASSERASTLQTPTNGIFLTKKELQKGEAAEFSRRRLPPTPRRGAQNTLFAGERFYRGVHTTQKGKRPWTGPQL